MRNTAVSTGKDIDGLSHPVSEMVSAVSTGRGILIVWRDGSVESVEEKAGVIFDLADRCPWAKCTV